MSIYPIYSPVSASVATITNTDDSVDASNASSYTFSSQALGTADSTRKIIIGVEVQGASSGTTSAVTVAGISATAIVTRVYSTEHTVGLWLASVPTGTTGDVVLTQVGTGYHAGIGVWATYDMSSSATDTLVASETHPLTGTIDVPENGICVGMYGMYWQPATWSAGITKDFETAGLDAYDMTGASDAFATAQSGMTVTASQDASGGGYQSYFHGFVIASFGSA